MIMKNFLISIEFYDFYNIKFDCELTVQALNVEHANEGAFMLFANEIAKMKTVYVQRMTIIKIKQYNEIPKNKFKIN